MMRSFDNQVRAEVNQGQMQLHPFQSPHSAPLCLGVRKCSSALVAGTHQQLPKYTPSSVSRACKSECAPYLELASAYGKSDEAVNKVIASHAQTFQEVRPQCWAPFL